MAVFYSVIWRFFIRLFGINLFGYLAKKDKELLSHARSFLIFLLFLKLVVLIQPFFHQLYIPVVVLYKAHMAACPEKLPLGIRNPVIHVFCDVRRTQVISAVDDKRRLLDVLKLLGHIVLLERSHRGVLVRAPSYNVGLAALLDRTP